MEVETALESKKRNAEHLESNTVEGESSQPPQQQAVVGEVDRITDLPDGVKYFILSFLEPLEFRQTSILSRNWKNFHNESPIVEIDELEGSSYQLEEFSENVIEIMRRREVFLDALQLVIKNHDWEYLQKLYLRTAANGDDEVDSLIHELLASALKTKARLDLELIYFTKCYCEGKFYVLPGLVFSCGSCLVVLFLQGCKLGSHDSINLPCLKTFTLKNVFVSDQILSKMVSSLPAIDTLELIVCHGLKVLSVFNPNLKVLEVFCCDDVANFELNVPNLQTLKIQANDELVTFNFNTDTQVQASKACSCPFLHTLHLTDVEFGTDQAFKDMIVCFPEVQNMTLRGCTFTSRPEIYCSKLRKYEVIGCYMPDKPSLVAPELESFYLMYNNDVILMNSPSDIRFKCLKILSLEGDVVLTDDLFQFMISFLSLLETLQLRTCTGFYHMRIISDSLKFLIVDNCPEIEDGEIEAPKLSYFKYVGCIFDLSRVIALEQLSVELHLSLHFDEGTALYTTDLMKLRVLISKFYNVKKVTVKDLFEDNYMEDGIELIAENIVVSEARRCQRHLMLKMDLERGPFIHIIPIVLNVPFCREKFIIDLGSSATVIQLEERLDRQSNADDHRHDCLENHIVYLRINDFRGNMKEMWLLEYLLSKFKKCKRVILFINKECSSSRREEIQTQIRLFRNSSPDTEILFCW